MKNWQFTIIVVLLLIIIALICIQSNTIVNIYQLLKITWL